MQSIRVKKKEHSIEKITALSKSLSSVDEISALSDLTIFVSGSYARLEASKYSDIDLFFIQHGMIDRIASPNISTLRMFSEVIKISDDLNFPKFSNDGEFLKILESKKILEGMGGRNDDYDNYFTARLLMILESRPVYNESAYDRVMKELFRAYFKDYPDHPKDFQPIFLVNDILRFWKTLCLNYENKRNQPDADYDRKLKQKVKNLKLKFSRMLTCFGSISYIAARRPPMDVDDILSMMAHTPLERLEAACVDYPSTHRNLEKAQELYDWFLSETDVTEDELLTRFNDKNHRTTAFAKANDFGGCIFEITREISETNNYLRFLLV